MTNGGRLALIFLPLAAAVLYALRSSNAQAAIAPSSDAGLSSGGVDWNVWDTPDDVLGVVDDPGVIPTSGASFFAPLSSGFGELMQTVKKTFALPSRAAPYAETITQAEVTYGLPQDMLARLLNQESRFRPDIINGDTVSPAGALGIAQFMPATAAELGIDPLDPTQAINGAARYLRSLFNQLGDWTRAVAAYNWGIGNVQRKGLAQAPLETRNYIAAIIPNAEV